MSTLVPHLSMAITVVRLHGAGASRSVSATGRPSYAAGGAALVVLLIGLMFVASVVRVARQIAALLSQLLQVAATVGAALVAVLILAGLAVIALLH